MLFNGSNESHKTADKEGRCLLYALSSKNGEWGFQEEKRLRSQLHTHKRKNTGNHTNKQAFRARKQNATKIYGTPNPETEYKYSEAVDIRTREKEESRKAKNNIARDGTKESGRRCSKILQMCIP